MNDNVELIKRDGMCIQLSDTYETSELVTRKYNDNYNENTKNKTNNIEYYFKFGLHICFHILFLSLLEPLLFFNYVVIMENKILKTEFNNLITSFSNTLLSNHNTVRNDIYYKYLIDALVNKDIYIGEFIYNLQEQSTNSRMITNKLNNELEKKAFIFFYVILFITCMYYCIFQYIYRKKHLLKKILLKHLGLIIFLFLYELWFFQNIILNYSLISQQELVNYLTQCFLNNLFINYPETSCILHNVTLTCNS